MFCMRVALISCVYSRQRAPTTYVSLPVLYCIDEELRECHIFPGDGSARVKGNRPSKFWSLGIQRAGHRCRRSSARKREYGGMCGNRIDAQFNRSTFLSVTFALLFRSFPPVFAQLLAVLSNPLLNELASHGAYANLLFESAESMNRAVR